MKKSTGIILGVFAVIAALVVGLSVGFYLNTNKGNDKENSDVVNKDNVDNKDNDSNDEERNGKKLSIYETTLSAGKVIATVSDYHGGGIKYEITCRSNDCEGMIYGSNEMAEVKEIIGLNGYALVNDDNEIVLYNYKTDTVVKKFKTGEVSEYSFLSDNETVLLKNKASKIAIYNYISNKYVTGFEYDEYETRPFEPADIIVESVGYLNEAVVFNNSIVLTKGNNKYLINLDTGKQTVDGEYDEIKCYLKEQQGNDGNQYCKFKVNNKYKVVSFRNNTKKIDNLVYAVDEFYGIVEADNNKDYAYVNKDSKLVLIDLGDYSTVTTFDNFDESNKFILTSSYRINLSSIKSPLIQFNKDTSSYNSCIEYYYDLETLESVVKDDVECWSIAKPILYLYPTVSTKVTVSFKRPELLTTTYPKFTGTWEVTANPNGDLYDAAGKYYYGLYWEEIPTKLVNFDEGFYVEGADAIEFLEEKLSYIGLNDRERNEFIMYWLPILEKNGKNLIYFELTDERESNNKINITPTPDSLLRIVMHVKGVNEKVSIKEEKLTKFQRHGFTAVEWGGYNY